ncbi:MULTISPECIES: multidrug efflux SMR transporter [Mammaliicoccus]|uniref:Multidrug efflux SMR transporter n=2 Tax=Bacteria TaxID=2 RepID=A0AB37HN25_MAMSC|nr:MULTISPECIES: multidrug efflux SMR transporter [Mammaliicoccus]RXY87821.1 QacE family quaternary ammonium compound efflux SMR transporter [Salmonella sp. 3DZ2-4SM]CPQ95553.1 sugE protein [Staphylococcus aureus]MCD8799795.1 multidrug efflux SMR transporter [Mammaliicoccus sciuri]MCD8819314.1 multidrug efflux SMR transporter [Mammaliicoccus sciuri]MCD8894993.1 multidrug efflux SMR transporter [Mammaliicoccus sciuri]
MAWIVLILAGLFEMLGVLFMNIYAKRNNIPSLLGLGLFFVLSFICLSIAMNTIPMSTSYAIWTGIGAVGGALLGIVFYGESKEFKRILFIGIILASTIGLKLIS